MRKRDATAASPSRHAAIAALALLLTHGCVCTRSGPVPSPARASGACVPTGRWVDPATDGLLRHEAVVARAARARVVLLGEEHDVAEHHRWQLDVVSALLGRRDRVVLGFEAVARSAQTALDDWSAGRIDAATLLERTRWRETWGVDPDLYLPLFHLARMHRIPVVALNVSRRLVVAVSRSGWAGVPAAEREGVGDPAPATPAYRERLLAVYAEHACREPAQVRDAPAFQRFVDAQLTWDRAMAEALAAAGRAHPGALVIGIVGRGHLEDGADAGVPYQLHALGVRDVDVLLPWDAERSCADLVPGIADAVFGVRAPADERAREQAARAALRPPCPPPDR